MTGQALDIGIRSQRQFVGPARARPFVKWAGGKRVLLPEIAQRIPENFEAYWEPFLGGGAVFFALDSVIRSAHLSDVNAELALTFQTIRNKPEAVIELLAEHAAKHSKAHYMRVRKMANRLDATELAARFIYLNKTCYNGLYRVNKNGQFNVPMGSYKNPTICDADNIRAASDVLQKATVKIGDFAKLNPGPNDFVYCDPPYDDTFNGYDANRFSQDDQHRLSEAAMRWHNAGAFVMISNSDTPRMRELYSRPPFSIAEVAAPRNINSDGNGRGKITELLITTY